MKVMLNSQVMMNFINQVISNTNVNISVHWISMIYSVKVLLDLDKSLGEQDFFFSNIY